MPVGRALVIRQKKEAHLSALEKLQPSMTTNGSGWHSIRATKLLSPSSSGTTSRPTQWRVVFGTEQAVEAKLKSSRVGKHINTSFVERNNLRMRRQNRRLVVRRLLFQSSATDWSNSSLSCLLITT